MKSKYQTKQIFTLLNQLAIIIFLCLQYLQNIDTKASSIMALSLISIMIISSAYIQFNNLKESCVLSQFSNLLLFLSWVLLLLRSNSKIILCIGFLLYIFLPYRIIQFLLVFIFQDSAYIHKKQINIILTISCLLTTISMLNNRLFSIMFMAQWFVSFICLFYILYKHKNRIIFVLKQERKNLIYSFIVTMIPYIVYIFFFAKQPNYMGNIGLYIIITLPLFSIYSIIHNNCHELNQYFILNSKKNILLSICMLGIVILLGKLFNFNIMSYFILGHCLIFMVLLYLTFLYSEMNQIISEDNHKNLEIREKNFYMNNILHISREEEIKKDFSNYLHDEILQDLLSIKNIMYKVNKPLAKEIIIETLNNLNSSIREQMQEYHPTILRSLTLKENLSNLIEMIRNRYYKKNIDISFICDEHLFLIEPYNLIIYRMLKELITNAFKHSKCKKIWVYLSQDKEKIELLVEDDGIGLKNTDLNNHNGLISIKEQVNLLGGKIIIAPGKHNGLCVTIKITMRGDNSYEHFINR